MRSNRERAVAKHLHERETMFDQNCSPLSKDVEGLGGFLGFDIKGSPA